MLLLLLAGASGLSFQYPQSPLPSAPRLWLGGILAPNNIIWCIPSNYPSYLLVNSTSWRLGQNVTLQTDLLPTGLTSGSNPIFNGAIRLADPNLFITIPCASPPQVVDMIKGQIVTNVNLPIANQKICYVSGTRIGYIVYSVPLVYNSTAPLLVINSSANYSIFSLMPLDIPGQGYTGVALLGPWLVPVLGRREANTNLQLNYQRCDPASNQCYNAGFLNASNISSRQVSLWSNPVVINSTMYAMPAAANCFLELDMGNSSANFTSQCYSVGSLALNPTDPLLIPTDFLTVGGVLVGDEIYTSPGNTNQFISFNVASKNITATPTPLNNNLTIRNYGGVVLAGDFLFMIPHQATTYMLAALDISTFTYTFGPSPMGTPDSMSVKIQFLTNVDDSYFNLSDPSSIFLDSWWLGVGASAIRNSPRSLTVFPGQGWWDVTSLRLANPRWSLLNLSAVIDHTVWDLMKIGSTFLPEQCAVQLFVTGGFPSMIYNWSTSATYTTPTYYHGHSWTVSVDAIRQRFVTATTPFGNQWGVNFSTAVPLIINMPATLQLILGDSYVPIFNWPPCLNASNLRYSWNDGVQEQRTLSYTLKTPLVTPVPLTLNVTYLTPTGWETVTQTTSLSQLIRIPTLTIKGGNQTQTWPVVIGVDIYNPDQLNVSLQCMTPLSPINWIPNLTGCTLPQSTIPINGTLTVVLTLYNGNKQITPDLVVSIVVEDQELPQYYIDGSSLILAGVPLRLQALPIKPYPYPGRLLFSWSMTQGVAQLSPLNLPSIAVSITSTQDIPVSGIQFWLTVLDRVTGRQGSTTLMVAVAQPPHGGNCSAGTTSGEPLSTVFNFTCVNFVNANTYEFWVLGEQAGARPLYIQDFSLYATASTTLAAGNWSAFAVVMSAEGAQTDPIFIATISVASDVDVCNIGPDLARSLVMATSLGSDVLLRTVRLLLPLLLQDTPQTNFTNCPTLREELWAFMLQSVETLAASANSTTSQLVATELSNVVILVLNASLVPDSNSTSNALTSSLRDRLLPAFLAIITEIIQMAGTNRALNDNFVQALSLLADTVPCALFAPVYTLLNLFASLAIKDNVPEEQVQSYLTNTVWSSSFRVEASTSNTSSLQFSSQNLTFELPPDVLNSTYATDVAIQRVSGMAQRCLIPSSPGAVVVGDVVTVLVNSSTNSGFQTAVRFTLPVNGTLMAIHGQTVAFCDDRNHQQYYQPLPDCVFWNGTDWSGAGCTRDSDITTLPNSTQLVIWCKCYHLTEFTALLPNYNGIASADVNFLTAKNLVLFPAPSLFLLLVTIFFLSALPVAIRKDRTDKNEAKIKRKTDGWAAKSGQTGSPSMALQLGGGHKSMLSASISSEESDGIGSPRSSNSPSHMGHSQPSSPKISNKKRVKIAFQRNHLWLSVAFRKSGISYKSVDRLLALYTSVLVALMLNATFYGSHNLIGVFGAAVVSAIVGFSLTTILAVVFTHTSPPGYRDRFEAAQRGVPLRNTYHWGFKVLAYILCLSLCGVCIFLILTLGLKFDRQSESKCTNALNAAKWVLSCVVSLILDIFVIRPIRILLLAMFQAKSGSIMRLVCGRLCCCCPFSKRYVESPPEELGMVTLQPAPPQPLPARASSASPPTATDIPTTDE